MYRFIWLQGVLLFFLCADLVAATELPYQGTWSGTIGVNKVQVCFSGNWDSQYYYLRHKKSIGLIQDEKDASVNEWKENVRNKETFRDEVTGVWKINQVTHDKLQGTWINPNTQESLDINLRHLSTPKQGCDAVFYAPMEKSIKYTYGTGKFENKSYKTIKTDAGETFEVPKTVKNSKKLNVFIQSWLKQQTIDGDECQQNGGGWEGTTLQPIFWTAHWLVMEYIMPDTFCGGAHGNWSIAHYVFNLDSGEQINMWAWLKEGEKSMLHDEEKPSPLRVLLEKLNPRDDCDDNSFSVMPHPTKQGLVFSTSHAHVTRACDDDILINYQDLTPYLTPLGKAAVQSIMQDK